MRHRSTGCADDPLRGRAPLPRLAFQFQASLSLPWYAIVGAAAALKLDLPYLAAVLVGVISATSGRYLVDISSGVTPKLFVRGDEWYVGTAILASVAYIVCADGLDLSIWPAALISFTVAFMFRYTAMHQGWQDPDPVNTRAHGRG